MQCHTSLSNHCFSCTPQILIWYLFFSSFPSKRVQISLVTLSLTHGLFRMILFTFQTFGEFSSDLSLFFPCGFMFCRQKTHFVRLRSLTFIETCFVQCYGPCWWMFLIHLKWMCVFPVWAIYKYQVEHIGCWGCSSLPYPYWWCPGNLFIQFLKY